MQRLRELTDGVLLATSRNYATTTTVLLDGTDGCVVIDPTWDPDELETIPADLAEIGVRCIAGVATHQHYDHVLWHPGLGDVPRWASERTVADLDADREFLLAPLAEFLTPDLIDIAGRLDVVTGDVLPWAGGQVSLHRHDAHAPGHLALLVENSAVLIAGDMLSDVELPMPDPDDESLGTYVDGLETLREACKHASWVIPGHGTPSNKVMQRFDADRAYLDDLLSNRRSSDPRINDPINTDVHAANLRRAANH